jgi:hypothetical protein
MINGIDFSSIVPSISNTNIWKARINNKDREVIRKIINGVVIVNNGRQICIEGKIKSIVSNPYSSILSQYNDKKVKQKKIATFIMEEYHDPSIFNEYIMKKRQVATYNNSNHIDFTQYKELDLYLEPSTFDIYRKTNDNSWELRLLVNLNANNARNMVFNHIKMKHNHLPFLKNVTSESRVFNVFREEIYNGYHRLEPKHIKHISNNKDEYCHSYIDLNFNQIKNTPTWDSFLNMFETTDMRIEYQKWIYGVLYQDDIDRRVMWIEGKANTGKTTTTNVISDYLENINNDLVGTLSPTPDKFSLSGLDKTILIIYADAQDNNFFKRRDVLNITGGDKVYYEEKYKGTNGKKIFSKIIVTSNYAPIVDKKHEHETSRLLHIKLDEGKVKTNKLERKNTLPNVIFRKKLKEELPYFFAKCKELYERCNE